MIIVLDAVTEFIHRTIDPQACTECLVGAVTNGGVCRQRFPAFLLQKDLHHAGNRIAAPDGRLTAFENFDAIDLFQRDRIQVESIGDLGWIVYRHAVDHDQEIPIGSAAEIRVNIGSRGIVGTYEHKTRLRIQQFRERFAGTGGNQFRVQHRHQLSGFGLLNGSF